MPAADPSGPPRSRLIVGVAVAVAFALVAALVAALVVGNDDAGTASSPTELPTATAVPGPGQGTNPQIDPTQPPSSDPPATVAPTEFDAQIDQIAAFVEQARGLTFKTRPVVVALSDADFVARFRALNEENQIEYASEYAAATVTYQALGLLVPGLSYADTANAFGDAGVVGFYDPETEELSVRGNAITPFIRTVIAHELVHALDDQNFDLDRPEYNDADDEIGFGLSAVAEGNARRIENLYVASMSDADQRSAQVEELSFGGDFPIEKFTQAFLKLQIAPYTLGEAFVSNLVEIGGQAALDQAFVAPPTTSEQIINIGAYLNGETYVDVDLPSADGEVVDDGLVGQMALQYLLESTMSASQARQATTGWAGDGYVAWQNSGTYCAAMTIEMDTASETQRLKSAFDQWIRSRPSGTVAISDNQVLVRTCS